MRTTAIILGIILLGFAIYVRIAPFDPEAWHPDPADLPKTARQGHREAIESDLPPAPALEKLSAIAAATPRTELLAGSVASGRLTYITRSKLWRFPDATTIAVYPKGDGSELRFYARQRFGRGDGGVNAARVKDWIRRFQS